MSKIFTPPTEDAPRSPAEVYEAQFVPALFRPWGPVLCEAAHVGPGPVSYTHLTLPTILLV